MQSSMGLTGTLWLFCYFATIFRLTSSQSFRSVEDYYFNIGKDETLWDTRILPDGQDVNIALFKNEPQSFFYPVESPGESVSITVIPCSSAIEWQVYYHMYAPEPKSSFKGDPLYLQESSANGLSSSSPLLQSTVQYLHLYHGRDMTTFTTNSHFLKGVIRVILTSTESHSKAELFLSSNPPQYKTAFPLLPTKPDIDIISNERSSVTVAWKPTPSHVLLGQHIKYCVAFNPKRDYRTLCALKADLVGELPPSYPRNAGFGFPWENLMRRRLSHFQRNMLKKLVQQQQTEERGQDIHFQCVDTKHWATVTSLSQGQKYFVNVFAINKFTNHSVTYPGITFTTVGVGKSGGGRTGAPVMPPHSASKIQTGMVQILNFDRWCADLVKMEVVLRSGRGSLILPLQKRKQHQSLWKYTVKNAAAGNYTIRLEADQQRWTSAVKLCVTGSRRKCPYSGIPNDLSVRAVALNGSDGAMQLLWESADVLAEYCLYVRRIDRLDEADDDQENPRSSNCSGLFDGSEHVARWRNDSERILCNVYGKNNSKRFGKKIVETVHGLRKDARYAVYLQAVLKQGVVVDYNRVIFTIK